MLLSERTSFLKSHFCIFSFGATPAFSAHNTGCTANSEIEILYTRLLPSGGGRVTGRRVEVSATWKPMIWKGIRELGGLTEKTTSRFFFVTRPLSLRGGFNCMKICWLEYHVFKLSPISTALLNLPFIGEATLSLPSLEKWSYSRM